MYMYTCTYTSFLIEYEDSRDVFFVDLLAFATLLIALQVVEQE